VEYWSTDRIGHQEAAKTIPINIDLVAPSVSATVNPPGQNVGGDVWHNVFSTVSIAASDAQSGILPGGTGRSIDGAPFAVYTAPFAVTGEGAHTVDYRIQDLAGNVTSGKQLTVRVDTAPPVTSASLAGQTVRPGWYRSAVTVTLSASDAGVGIGPGGTLYRVNGSAPLAYAGPFILPGSATYTVEYWSLDRLGNSEVHKTVAVNVDTVAPTITSAASPAGVDVGGGIWHNVIPTVTITASDNLSGIVPALTTRSINGGPFVLYAGPFTLPNGVHTVDFRTEDAAGNVAVGAQLVVRVDTVAPVTALTLQGEVGSAGWFIGPVTVTLSAVDFGSGVPSGSVLYRIDGGTDLIYSTPFVIEGEGSHTIEYRSVDATGNAEAERQATALIDTVAPVTAASVSGPLASGNVYNGPVTVALSATDVTSGVASTEYTLGDSGTGWSAYEGPITVDSLGETVVSFRSQDAAGNMETVSTVSFMVNGPPSISSDSDQVLSFEGGAASNTGSYSDPDGHALQLTATVGAVTWAGGEWSWSGPSSDGPAQYDVVVVATDGFDSAQISFTVSVLNVSPTIQGVSNSGPVAIVVGAIVSVAASDLAGIADPLQYSFDCDNDGIFEGGPQSEASSECAYQAPGSFLVNVMVADGDGGVSLGSTTIDVNDPPESSIGAVIEVVSEAVENGTLTGDGPGNSAGGKLNAWRNKLSSAQFLLSAGDTTAACTMLQDAYKFADGIAQPPDHVTGPERAAIAAQLIDLMAEIGCPAPPSSPAPPASANTPAAPPPSGPGKKK